MLDKKSSVYSFFFFWEYICKKGFLNQSEMLLIDTKIVIFSHVQ